MTAETVKLSPGEVLERMVKAERERNAAQAALKLCVEALLNEADMSDCYPATKEALAAAGKAMKP